MQHPQPGKEPDNETFLKIQHFARKLLGDDDLTLEIVWDQKSLLLNMHGNRLPLESFGTGVHQLIILCAAFAIYPDRTFMIEEPELHMHPDLQRHMRRFILDETKNRFFITTHSNVFLDFAPEVSIYHVTYDGQRSTVWRVDNNARTREVLSDLGYKASDLLQANCIIWVEGPSDRIFINRWLELAGATELIENIHYMIMFYGGSCLSHVTCADEEPDAGFISLLHMNRHAIVVMDRDGKSLNEPLREAKKRIIEELGDGDLCWVTRGREIENYIRPERAAEYVQARCGKLKGPAFGKNDRFPEYVKKAGGVKIVDEKVKYARAIVPKMRVEDLDCLDLRKHIDIIIRKIREWNKSPIPMTQQK